MSALIDTKGVRLAMVTAGDYVGACLPVCQGGGDSYDMYAWGSLFRGYHFSFESLREDGIKILKDNYDVIIFSGNPGYCDDIIRICSEMPKAVKIFFPEGDTSLYFRQAIFQKVIDAMNACDVLGAPEEDRLNWWQSLTAAKARFLHVPIPLRFYNYYLPRAGKMRYCMVYGDNNPNNPITALHVAGKLSLGIITVKVSGAVEQVCVDNNYCLLKAYPIKIEEGYFFNMLRQSMLMVYPTSWVGTARQNIAAALCGVPCIGSRDSHTQMRLFPELAVNIWDVGKMLELGERLLKDDAWYDDIARSAHHEALFYNEKEAVRRLLAIIDEVKK